jgi:ABC-type transport system substrate-binding protein
MLAASWSVSDDFLTWTWKFHEDVQSHKGCGEMTAEDVLYSYIKGTPALSLPVLDSWVSTLAVKTAPSVAVKMHRLR